MRKPYAGLKKLLGQNNVHWKKKIAHAVHCEEGGGLGTLFIGLAVLLPVLVIFINIADYSVFTFKRNAVAKALEYAVTASVQQINENGSREGLSEGFSEVSGKNLQNGLEIDFDSALNTFFSVYYENCNEDFNRIENKLLLCTTTVRDGNMKYRIKAGIGKDTNSAAAYEGTLGEPSMLEEKINSVLMLTWPDASDTSELYINGNPRTNMIENGTYIFAMLRDMELTGVFSRRKINLSSFAGAKVERFVQN